ncbi:hypothetical protein [Mycobacteroides abscessus]|uniref:hypothetical protein n=1 Tax=Mycobacteroides abscessus TaxID=36809 RepID=UPI0009A81686|nr:hypothetical protein [Mycobacteroides abscessus]SLD23430.1 Uncharacterised protein [Mycobacteroides abscessus subsp. massiliense]SLD41652.1 Uncharacterised protein [Mycobacteroides abscessus subsp. massiliense]
MITNDPYPELPALPLSERLALQIVEPEHFLLSPEAMEESYAVHRAIHALVVRHVGYRGPREVDYTTHAALMAVRFLIERHMQTPDSRMPAVGT